jgi:hypothetical protein
MQAVVENLYLIFRKANFLVSDKLTAKVMISTVSSQKGLPDFKYSMQSTTDDECEFLLRPYSWILLSMKSLVSVSTAKILFLHSITQKP